MMLCALTAGCLWPASLTEAADPNDQVPPAFVSSDPVFGPFTQQANLQTDLIVSAVDPNPDPNGNRLYIRILQLGSTGPSSRFWPRIADQILSYPPGTDILAHPETPLTGSFFPPSGTVLCTQFPKGGELFAEVADRPFAQDPDKPNTAPGGLVTENHWELTCE